MFTDVIIIHDELYHKSLFPGPSHQDTITFYMPRKIPSYKRVVTTAPGEAPQLPPALAQSELDSQAMALARPPEGKLLSEESIPAKKMPPKILTTMEIRSRIIGLMNERNYDPIRELIKIANNNTTDEKTRIEIHKELAQYIAPKLKSTDLQVSGDLQLTVNVVKFSTASGQQLAPNREAIPVRAIEVAS